MRSAAASPEPHPRAVHQGDIGHEFNRRMKIKFDQLGIQLFPSQRVIYVAGEGTRPAAPAQAAVAEAKRSP
jgi:hypothetical protein